MQRKPFLPNYTSILHALTKFFVISAKNQPFEPKMGVKLGFECGILLIAEEQGRYKRPTSEVRQMLSWHLAIPDISRRWPYSP